VPGLHGGGVVTRTQRARLLDEFRRAGRRGLTVIDAQQMRPPIQGFTARMCDLRAEGHTFERAGRRDKCVCWVLIRPTSTPSTVSEAYEAAGGRPKNDPPPTSGDGIPGAVAPVRTPGFAPRATPANPAGASSHATGARDGLTAQLQLGAHAAGAA
jgi:hypothetical protein